MKRKNVVQPEYKMLTMPQVQDSKVKMSIEISLEFDFDQFEGKPFTTEAFLDPKPNKSLAGFLLEVVWSRLCDNENGIGLKSAKLNSVVCPKELEKAFLEHSEKFFSLKGEHAKEQKNKKVAELEDALKNAKNEGV